MLKLPSILPHRLLSAPETQENFEEIEKILGEHVQFILVEHTFPGGSAEANKIVIPLSVPVNAGALAFSTIFSSGFITIGFVQALTLTKLEVGCTTVNGVLPAAGSKQKIAWMVISP